MNAEEKQVINLFNELLNKYDKQGAREARDGLRRVSVFGRQWRFDLSKSFPLFTHRQHFLRAAFEEVMWYLRGQTDNQILKDKNVHVWDLWEGQIDEDNPTELGKIYGHMFRKFGATSLKDQDNFVYDYYKGFDQVSWVLNELKENPSSSRLIISNWDPVVSTNTPKEAVLPCCLTLLQFFTEAMDLKEREELLHKEYEGGTNKAFSDYLENTNTQLDDMVLEEVLDYYSIPKLKLSLQLYQRSSDTSVSSGWNTAQMAIILHLFAQQSGMAVGEYVWTGGDVHLYEDQVEDVREMVSKEIHKFPQIKIKKAKDIFSYEWSDLEIVDYTHSGKIGGLKVSI